MKILIALTYFTPYKSGLTVYAERLARALVERGHQVTVLTSQHKSSLSREEIREGVHIVRMPVALRLSKGVIMPSILHQGWRWVGWADVVNLHLPQFDAAWLSVVAKIRQKPVIVTYHCDLSMPVGWFSQLAGRVANLANHLAARNAKVIVHNTQDFAEYSLFLQKYKNKVQIIPPPIVVEPVSDSIVEGFKYKHGIQSGQVILGMAARLATEKGVEYLVEAMTIVLKAHPTARVLFAGEYREVIGEQAYREKVMPLIEGLGWHWTFLGVLTEAEKTAFFKLCNLLVLPSINTTESFGMVQVEAMTCGTPVVLSDLPGVRQPVLQGGMGQIVPIQDANALAEAILAVLENYPVKVDVSDYVQAFAPEKVAARYEALFAGLL